MSTVHTHGSAIQQKVFKHTGSYSTQFTYTGSYCNTKCSHTLEMIFTTECSDILEAIPTLSIHIHWQLFNTVHIHRQLLQHQVFTYIGDDFHHRVFRHTRGYSNTKYSHTLAAIQHSSHTPAAIATPSVHIHAVHSPILDGHEVV